MEFDNNLKQTENKIKYIVMKNRNHWLITLVTSQKRLSQSCKITNKTKFCWIQNINSIFNCLKAFTLSSKLLLFGCLLFGKRNQCSNIFTNSDHISHRRYTTGLSSTHPPKEKLVKYYICELMCSRVKFI